MPKARSGLKENQMPFSLKVEKVHMVQFHRNLVLYFKTWKSAAIELLYLLRVRCSVYTHT